MSNLAAMIPHSLADPIEMVIQKIQSPMSRKRPTMGHHHETVAVRR